MSQLKVFTTVFFFALLCAGCASYVTPAGGVSLAEVSDESLAKMYDRKPASAFPANLAVMRVQDSGYFTKTNRGYGNGRYSIDTTFTVDGISLGPLTLISLGLLPNKQAHVTATIAGVRIDISAGYVHGQGEAYSTFVQDFESLSTGALNVHATSTPAQAPDNAGWYYTRN